MQLVVADDDEVSRELVQEVAEEWGFEVLAADNGGDACELLLSPERPQLAVIDWIMPVRDGISVCEVVRQQRPLSELFILMLTGRTAKDDLACALSAGANDFVSKPFDSRELKARIQAGCRLLARERHCEIGIAPATTGSEGPQERWVMPMFDNETMEFSYRIPPSILREWERQGVLESVWLDCVQLCPRCHGPPTFRFGCNCCGSGRVRREQMIHHFTCGYVGAAADFERGEELVCPKCRRRGLIVGADFEYSEGPHRCLDCAWSGFELEHIAHCLRCGFRFPSRQAFVQDLIGYHARRLGALAEITDDR